jgi:hypothetical protein
MKETLEEAAANLADPNVCKTENWIAGAKWQAEKMYNEEEVEDLIHKVCGTVARLQGITLNGNYVDTAYKQFKKNK